MTARFVPDPDWPTIVELAIKRWGKPNKALSKRDDIRWGSKGSKSVKPSGNTWFDHEANEGGGYVEMHEATIGPLPKPKHKGNGKANGEVPPWENVGPTYRYTDADGRLILEVVRTLNGQPRFIQRAPDASSRSGWKWSVKHIPNHDKLLYRLPDLHALGDEIVWITEGEKDADRLHEAGLIATTNIGGAGKWRDEYAAEFRGKRCVVLADNDPQAKDKTGKLLFHPDGRPVLPGQDHAARVASCLAGIAASVKVLLLPGLPEKGDVSDWLDAAHTFDELVRLAREAPEYQPPGTEPEPDGDGGPEPEAKPAELFGPPTLADLSTADLARMDEIAFGRIVKPKAALLGVTPAVLTKARSAAKAVAAKAARDAEKAARDAANAAEKAARDGKKAAKANAVAEAKAAAAAAKAKDKADKQAEANGPVDQLLLAEFNEKYFVVNESGRAVIYAPKHDPILNRRLFERLSFGDLERLYSNRLVKIGEQEGQPVFRQAAKVWLGHRNRKQFIGGVVFDPSTRKHPDDVLNLWDGFAVTPAPGSWALLKEHIRTVICRNNTDIFNYLLDWMADVVQNPGKQGEVCVVLCGEEGSGKGILARAIKHLLGQHGLAISNSKHLTGNFNSHLRDCIFLFADEAFYAGDKQHIGILKALVTEDTITIEGKYQNAIQSPNFLHIMMASNETWVVPASLRSRRWLVLDVDDSRLDDHVYFGSIQNELNNGGHAAMLDELLNRIPFGNLRKVPVTAALQTQRKLSLPTAESWWLDCLHRGFVYQSRHGLEDHFGQWHDFVATEVLFASYIQYCQAHHERRPLPRELFGAWMQANGAKPRRRRNQAVGEHMVEATSDGRSSRIAEVIIGSNPHGYVLGDLSGARDAFISASGLGDMNWGSEVEG